MRLRAGRSSGALSGIEITCSCGAKKSMAGAFNENSLHRIGVDCHAERPWVGEEKEKENTQHCSQQLRVVQKVHQMFTSQMLEVQFIFLNGNRQLILN